MLKAYSERFCPVHLTHNLPDPGFKIRLGCLCFAVPRPQADDEELF